MFWSESDQLLTMTCYLVFDIFGRFLDPPTMNRKYTQWSVLDISSLCFWTVANDDDDHCFQSPALELIPMDMTGSESKQKEADGRKSTERNKISQNLPQGSSTPLTYQMTYPPSLETYDFEFTNFTLSCSVFLNKNTKLRKKCIHPSCFPV